MGLITYKRTDSIRISDYGINLAKKIIKDVVIHNRRNKAVFDAHEAIRITTSEPLTVIKNYLNDKEFRIYELIYMRFLASLSPVCRYVHQQLYSYLNRELYISYQSGRIIDKGFIKILPDFVEKFKIFKNDFLEPKNKHLEIIGYEIGEEFTKPPPRYTLSSIIKKMEEVGIGRPSTYASTIELLKKRKYVEVKRGSIYITDLGKRVVQFLFGKYSELLNVDFTANLEELLDSIENSDYEMAKKISFTKITEIYRMLK
ncbi:MAG: DNA topoisomerase [Candidatus Calescibacterium sp.]|nr:DNA topoisomerase [Candidatus Calescibacterium sp.]